MLFLFSRAGLEAGFPMSGGKRLKSRVLQQYPLPFMRRLLLALLPAAIAACATPATGVQRLNDGVFRAANEQEAQAYCRIDGNPIRFLTQADAPTTPGSGVLFRCD